MFEMSEKALEALNERQELEITNKIREARRRQSDHPKFKGWDGETCFDCGVDIPQARLDMGRVRCVECQGSAERKGIL